MVLVWGEDVGKDMVGELFEKEREKQNLDGYRKQKCGVNE